MKKRFFAVLLAMVVVLSGLQMPHVHAEDAAASELQTSLNAGGVVVLPAGETVIPAGTTVTVPADTTLVIPYGASVDASVEEGRNPYAAKDSVTKEMYSELVLENNAKLVVDGTVYVTAVTGMSGGTVQNVVTGGYGQITTEAGSQIVVNGTLENYGYVTGSGTLNAAAGAKVSDLFTIINFRGATHLASVVGGTSGYSDVFPLNETGTGNLQIKAYYNDGSSLYGNALIFAGGQENRDEFLIIGGTESASALYVQENGACIVKETVKLSTSDTVLNKERFLFDGDVSMRNSKLAVSITHGGVSLDLTLSTGNFLFPIAGNTTIEIVSGTTTMENGFKLMPGAKMLVHKGATLNVMAKNETASYGGFSCMGSTNAECTGYFVIYDYEAFAAVDSNITPAYSSGTTDAELVVNGLLKISRGATVAGNVIVCGDGEVKSSKSLVANPISEIEPMEAGALSTSYADSDGAQLTIIKVETDWREAEQEHTWGEGKPVETVDECGQECTMVHTCTTCGVTEEYTAVVEHKYEENVVAPTCTEAGYTAQTCVNCGDTKKSEEVAALGHDFESVVTAPTCGVDGYTTHTCTVCGFEEVDSIVAAAGHDYEAAVTAPTCLTAGTTKYTCKVCGHVYEETTATPLGHEYGAWTVVKEADCTNAGLEHSTCTRCNVYEEREIAALGHAYGEWTVVKKADCTNAGLEHNTCTRCNMFEERVIEALGHDYDEVVTAPTCTAGGYTTYTCSVCGHGYVGNETEAAGHKYEAVVTEPTCTAGGYTTYTCSVCEDSYVGNETEAAGHKYEAVVTEPTCTKGGYTTYTCSVCEDSYVGNETEAAGHKYEAVVTEPTCIKGGYTTYTCSVCEDSYVGNETEAAGHKYEAVVTEPTCTEGGYTTHTCENCDDTYVDTKVPALDHSYKEEVTAPTCTAEGYTTHTCENCDDSYVDEKVLALNHSFTSYVSDNNATCIADGTKTAKCDRCTATDTVTEEGTATGHEYVGVSCVNCGDKLVVDADEVDEDLTTIVDAILKGEVTEEMKEAVSEEVMEEIKSEVTAGNKVTSEIVVSEVTAVPEEDLKVIEEELDKNVEVAQYLDVQVLIKSVSPTGEEKTLGTMNELEEAVIVTVAIPEGLDVEGRTFYVYRAHEGKVDKLVTVNNGDGTLSFRTDRFSTYALAYEDQPKAPQAPATADSSMVVGYASMAIVALAVFAMAMKKRAFTR